MENEMRTAEGFTRRHCCTATCRPSGGIPCMWDSCMARRTQNRAHEPTSWKEIQNFYPQSVGPPDGECSLGTERSPVDYHPM